MNSGLGHNTEFDKPVGHSSEVVQEQLDYRSGPEMEYSLSFPKFPWLYLVFVEAYGNAF